MNTNEVFYNFNPQKVTTLKVKIEKPGNYGLGYISGDISTTKPTIIDWGNGTTTTLTTPITNEYQGNNSTDYYVNYSNPGEYVISIDGWYNHFKCNKHYYVKPDITQIGAVLIDIVQVSSLITSFYKTFENCKNLTNIPSGLFDKNTSVTRFESIFSDCSSLTGETPYTLSSDGVTKIKLWNRDETNGFTKPTSTRNAFYGCNGLDDFNKIPDSWK